jgi:beta-lactamase class D
MMKRLFGLLLTFLFATLAAETQFLLKDPVTDRAVFQVGETAAFKEPTFPYCSFNIALSLMGYNEGILIDEGHPVWDAVPPDEEREVCRHPQTPRSWITNSCIWYSQELTKRLGMEKFRHYVTMFEYGNQDLSGELGQDNGLTKAWLGSSLQINCEEQIEFVARVLDRQFPVSDSAYALTKKILYTSELPDGWTLYGKTGGGKEMNPDGTRDLDHYIGWYVGWVEKGDRRLFFALRLRHLDAIPTIASRHQLTKELLKQSGCLSKR